MKSVLVIDTPTTCRDCDLYQKTENDEWCGFDKDAVDPMFRADYCPLKPMPNKKSTRAVKEKDIIFNMITIAEVTGWNDCLKAIIGDEE